MSELTMLAAALTSARASIRRETTLAWPFSAARKSGVSPYKMETKTNKKTKRPRRGGEPVAISEYCDSGNA